jgi:hypothetical protein
MHRSHVKISIGVLRIKPDKAQKYTTAMNLRLCLAVSVKIS